MSNEALILAGGLGTRLRPALAGLPKPMAPVNGRPFLTYLLQYLKKEGINRVVLSVGYAHEKIVSFYGDQWEGISLCYAVEQEPLGTGGGIRLALQQTISDNVLILNGDSFFNVNLAEMAKQHEKENADMTIAVKKMTHFDRYGAVVLNGTNITGFLEKKHVESGYINGGIYLLNKNKFISQTFPEHFSFEKEFMEVYANRLSFQAYISDAYFLDIGLPETLEQAQSEFKAIFK